MPDKEPALLTILIDTSRMRWLAGAIGLDQTVSPLLASHDNDIAPYRDMIFDEQASFLRHRFCGILQRGCDRLWGLKKKACQFVFVIDDRFPDAPDELTNRVAEHLVQWMANPPVVFFSCGGGNLKELNAEMTNIAGEMLPEHEVVLTAALPSLIDEMGQADRWELVPLPKVKST